MKKIKHSLIAQRGFGRKISQRPGLTAPTASQVPDAVAGSRLFVKTRLTRRFGRNQAPASPGDGADAKKYRG
jgi:hypothetical protein